MKIIEFDTINKKYEHVWPDGDKETYQALELVSDEDIRVTIAFTFRHIFSRDRRKVVIFFDDWPAVEFTATDDYATTGELLSLIRRRGGRDYYSSDEATPPEYMGFNTTVYSQLIRQPGAYNSIAVVVNVADIRSMLQHALIQWEWRS